MKAKTWFAILTMAAVCSMAPLLDGSAHADEAWYSCRVQRAGGAWGNGYIKLTDTAANPAFADKWFSVRKGEEQQTKTIAMRAKNGGKTVSVNTDIKLGVYPRINALHADTSKSAAQASLYFRANPSEPTKGS